MDEKRRDAAGEDARLEDIIDEVLRERAAEQAAQAAPIAPEPEPQRVPEPARTERAAAPARRTARRAQPERKRPEKQSEKQPEKQPGRGKPIAIAAGAVCAALVVAVFGYTYLYGGIFRGVRAGNIDLGGMSESEAAARIEAERDTLLGGAAIELTIHKNTYSVDIGAVTDGLDGDATAAEAAAYGREGNPFARVGAALGALFGGHEIGLTVAIDEQALDARLDEIANEALTPPVDPSYTIENDELVIDTGRNGVDFDRAVVAAAVEEKIRTMDFTPYEVEVQAEQQAAVDLAAIQAEITAEPQNAIVDKTDGKTIIPSVDGVSMDLTQAERIVGDGSEQTYRIPLTLTAAKISADDLSKVLFRDTLASTSTSLNAGNRQRTNNVRLACEYINGTILNPGEEFSYNETVGQRTAARGFQSAGAYLNGRVVDEVGGGVCQPSSTLYMAVLRADLEVTKRSNHSFTVAYTPLGEDATVSWGGPDFCFRNDTDYPVKIYASQSGSSCNMKLVGTKTSDKTVTTKTEVLSTTEFAVIEKQDATLEPGTSRVDQTGSTGYKTVTYKIITENGETRTEKANTSTYSKRDKIVLVGPALTEPVDPAAPAETTDPDTPAAPAEPAAGDDVNPEA